MEVHYESSLLLLGMLFHRERCKLKDTRYILKPRVGNIYNRIDVSIDN